MNMWLLRPWDILTLRGGPHRPAPACRMSDQHLVHVKMLTTLTIEWVACNVGMPYFLAGIDYDTGASIAKSIVDDLAEATLPIQIFALSSCLFIA